MKRIYADITKAEEQSDGTIIVSGYASTPTADSDGETITTEAMAAALPDYMRFGAVREMHQPKAAGTAIEARIEPETGNTFFSAHVVDPDAVKKVKAKVYKGFSIGGKVLSRDTNDPNIITGIKLVEVSLVDRPANPDAVFTMYKADDGGGSHPPEELAAISQLTALVDSGQILPSQLVKLATTFIEAGESMLIGKEVDDLKRAAEVAKEEKMTDKTTDTKDEEVKTSAATKTTETVETKADKAEDVADTTNKGDGPKVEATANHEGPAKDAGHDERSEHTGDLVKMITAAVIAAIEPLQKRITELEARPAPSKAVLKVVGKGQDIEKGERELEDAPPAGLSPVEQVAWEIKKLHRAGGLL